MARSNGKAIEIGGEAPTNGAAEMIDGQQPYTVEAELEGVCPIIFHRWNCEAVEEKAKAAKGSKAKKTDDIESYLYRNGRGEICIPGEYVRQAIIHAAKFKQDPRSPRKSAMDLFKAAVVPLTDMASLGTKDYFEDRRRVQVQRNGITRVRPAIDTGWRATFEFTVLAPEYVSHHLFLDVLQTAGKLVGIADFRPTFGRFQVVRFSKCE